MRSRKQRSILQAATLVAALAAPATALALDGGTLRVSTFNGWRAFEVISQGDNPTGDGSSHSMPGIFDGAGAWLVDPATLRVQVNHETGDASVSEVDMDLAALKLAISNTINTGSTAGVPFVLAARQAYDRWSPDLGATWTNTSSTANTSFARFCSSQAYAPDTFGPGRGFVDQAYIMGEEVSSGRLFVIDSVQRDLYQLSGEVGDAGVGIAGMPFDSWENAALIDTGETDHVAILLSADGGSQTLQLYIGVKGVDANGNASNSFLARNGLARGSWFYLNGSLPGTQGASNNGTLDTSLAGALSSGKLEDVDTSPTRPDMMVLGDQTSGVFVFDFDLVFNPGFNVAASSFTITKAANEGGGSNSLDSPDNVDWTAATNLGGVAYPDGLIFVNEDNGSGEIWQMLPDGSNQVRIGQTTVGAESTGIFDVSEWVGYVPGSILVSNNQGSPSSMSVLINPAAELQVPLAPASISGQVWDDADRDGIRSAEPARAGVGLELLAGGNTLVASTVTGADGSYSFDDIAPGNYAVRVVLPASTDLSPALAGADPLIDNDFVPATATTALITLSEGEDVAAIDAAVHTITLASIGGRVWLDDGDGIFQGTETLLDNVPVQLLGQGGGVLASALTNASGEYQFSGLVAGTYEVAVDVGGRAIAPLDAGVDDTLDSDLIETTGVTAALAVSEGASLARTDAGLVDAAPFPDATPTDFNGVTFSGYASQDGSGNLTTADSGATVMLDGERWILGDETVEIFPDSILTFRFRAADEGEVHAIGFDENSDLNDAPRLFQLAGTETAPWAIQLPQTYGGNGAWQNYRIPIGQYYSGTGFRLVLINSAPEMPGSTATLVFAQNLEVTRDGAPTGSTYLGTQDAELREDAPNSNFDLGTGSSNPEFTVDGNDGGGLDTQVVMRFDDIFGNSNAQVPPGATINAATLFVDVDNTGDTLEFHQLNIGWGSESAVTWNSVGAGNDGVNPATGESAFLGSLFSGVFVNKEFIDVTSSLQTWSNGAPNHGWAFLPTGSDGVDFDASENSDPADRPALSVTFVSATLPGVGNSDFGNLRLGRLSDLAPPPSPVPAVHVFMAPAGAIAAFTLILALIGIAIGARSARAR